MDERRHAIERVRIGAGFLCVAGASRTVAEFLSFVGMATGSGTVSDVMAVIAAAAALVAFLCAGPPAYLLMVPAAWFAKENRCWSVLVGAAAYALTLASVVAIMVWGMAMQGEFESQLTEGVVLSVPPALTLVSVGSTAIGLARLYRRRRVLGVLVVVACCGFVACAIVGALGAIWTEAYFYSPAWAGAPPAWFDVASWLAAIGVMCVPPVIVVGSVAAFRHAERLITQVVRANECPRCLYDLSGHAGAVCPECGWEFPRAETRTEEGPRQERRECGTTDS